VSTWCQRKGEIEVVKVVDRYRRKKESSKERKSRKGEENRNDRSACRIIGGPFTRDVTSLGEFSIGPSSLIRHPRTGRDISADNQPCLPATPQGGRLDVVIFRPCRHTVVSDIKTHRPNPLRSCMLKITLHFSHIVIWSSG
jgi:hypothetical protein